MKNLSKVLALVLVVAMVFSFAVSAGAATSYKDDASINYQEAVQLLSALDVLNGYEDGSFKPGASITRAEVATMVSYLVANSNSENPLYSDIYKLNADYKPLCTFADSKNHWAAGFIAFCAGNGYISGRDANTFDPDATITIAECSVILLRVMGYNAKNEAFGTTAGTVNGYNTQLCARNAGLLAGLENNNFFAAATREQVAQLFLNALKGNVVNYGLNNYSLVVSNGDQNYTITLGGKAIVQPQQLVDYCFRNVECENAINEYGLAGHQWVSYVGTKAVCLTDVFVDDVVVATFPGKTTFAQIAATLGINKNSTIYMASVYKNGKAAGTKTLNSFYGAPGALNDNESLIVIKDYTRGIGNPDYKLMYYYEYLAVASNQGIITTPTTSAHLGEYLWKFDVYNSRQCASPVAFYMYGDKDTYENKGYYLIVPRDVSLADYFAGLAGTDGYKFVVEANSMLSVKAAELSEAVAITSADKADLLLAANTVYVNGDTTKAYNLSCVYNDFVDDIAFGAPVQFIYNSIGYVIGTVDASQSTIAGTGYVYLDSFEYAVTASAYSYMIDAKDYTWSAQAKANVYFPTAEGTTTPTVIDIQTVKSNAVAGYSGIANFTTTDAIETSLLTPTVIERFNGDNKLLLSTASTNAYWDKSTISSLGQTNLNGNVRVFDVTFDGWYKFTKFVDGTYALRPVEQDKFTATKGTYKYDTGYDYAVNGAAKTGTAWLNDKTSSTVYTMDLRTMTAKSAETVGYLNIGGALGFQGTAVGGEVNEARGYVTEIATFNVIGSTNIKYALYLGTAGYTPAKGYAYKFFVEGETKVYYSADDTDLPKLTPPAAKALYALVLDASGTTVNDATPLIPAASYAVDADWHKITFANNAYVKTVDSSNVAHDYVIDTAEVWDFNTGAAVTLAVNDMVYGYCIDGVHMLVTYVKPASGSVVDPYAP